MQQHPTFVALRRAFVGLILLSTLSTVAVAEILLVKTGSTGGTRLSSVTAANWNTSAYPTLRAALTASRSGDQIWVAAGTYYPDEGPGATDNSRIMRFTLKEGVEVYGGFAGTETSLESRNWSTNKTTLSGEIQQDDDISNNSYHVILNFPTHSPTLTGISSATVLDGFVITGGNASGGSQESYGGGMFMGALCSPTIRNCAFQGNQAQIGGGAHLERSSASIINCIFTGNKSVGDGSALIIVYYGLNPHLINCTIAGNQGNSAIYLIDTDPRLTNCIVWGNNTGIGVYDAAYSRPEYEFSLIQGLNPGGTNLDGTNLANDPLFSAPPSPAAAPTTAGFVTLQGCSPAINKGTVTVIPEIGSFDLNHNSRLIEMDIDMGAYEYQSTASINFTMTATPTQPLSCGATGSIQLSGLLANTAYIISYRKDNGAAIQSNYTTNANSQINLKGLAVGNYTEISALYGRCRYSVSGSIEIRNYSGVVYHVRKTGSDANNGLAWDTAFLTLQRALQAATCAGDQIWVAAGTYYPDEGAGKTNNDRNTTFNLKDGVVIYGGFPAVGNPTMANRNWATNQTTLSGEIQKDDDISNNAYHVIYNDDTGITSATVLDGFVISGGNATEGDAENSAGGGMFMRSSSPTIRNCAFQSNQAKRGGGALFYGSSSTISNSIFTGNKATIAGSALLIQDNTSPHLINCTIAGNHGDGSIFLSANVDLRFSNCIVWGNNTGVIIDDPGVSTPTYEFSLVQSLNPGGNNLDGTNPANDPLFVSQPDFNAAPTIAGDVRLLACSPAINAGDPAATSATVGNLDLGANPRFYNSGTLDMGAYEYQSTVVQSLTATITGPTDPCVNDWVDISGLTANVTYEVNYQKGANPVTAGRLTSNGSGVIRVSGLTAGVYTAFSATRGVCVSSATGTVTMGTLPSITVTTPVAQCGGSINLSTAFSSPNGTLTYFKDAGFSSQITDPASSSGRYYASAQNGSCTTTASVSVTINPLPTLSVTTPSVQCGSINLNTAFSSNGTLSYFMNSSFTSAATNPVVSSGTYYARTNLAGCTATASVSVSIATGSSIYYVRPTGNDANNGKSWGGAFRTVQKALQSATCAGSQIWVAAGTYYPDEGPGQTNNDRTSAFVMKEGVAIYGGFAGGEASLSSRNWALNATILSGEIQNDGNASNNARNVIKNVQNGLTNAAILDGFIVEGGISDLRGLISGGGMLNIEVSPTITNCIFRNNRASFGAGIYNGSANPIITNCIFIGNSSFNGGGMGCKSSNPILRNCTFSGNFSRNDMGESGGAMYLEGSSPTLQNCILWGNSTEVFNINSIPTYTNTLVRGLVVGGFNGTEDPLFVSQPDFNAAPTASGNVRLLACSPVVNRGNSTLNPTTLDLAGSPRKNGVIDLGAYELQGAAFRNITASVPNALLCEGSTLRLSVSSGGTGATYSWTGPGFSSNAQNLSRPNASPALSGAYSVTVSNGGCTALASTSVVVSPNVAPSITSLQVNNLSPNAQNTVGVCNTQEVKLNIRATNAVTYSWRGPTGAGSGFVSSMVSPVDMPIATPKTGQYTVTVRNGCAVFNHRVVNIQLVNCSNTRIASAEETEPVEMEINAYPNPVSKTLTVEVRLQEAKPLQLRMVNSVGQPSGEWNLSEPSTYHKTELDLSQLTGGVYLLEAQAGSQRAVKRVVKVQYE